MELPEHKRDVAVLTLAGADSAVQGTSGVSKGRVVQLPINIGVVAVISLVREHCDQRRGNPKSSREAGAASPFIYLLSFQQMHSRAGSLSPHLCRPYH